MPATGLELYREGERVPYSGDYALVNEEGDRQDYDPITLDEGDLFPERREENLYYMLNVTSLNDACLRESGVKTTPIPGTESDIPPDDLI
jgi:hypothetical protein